MGFFSSKPAKDSPEAVKQYKKARAKLDAYGKKAKREGIKDETSEYSALNWDVDQAMKNVSWWRR